MHREVEDMSLTIDLTPEETKRFEAAGIDLTSFLKGIAATLPQESSTTKGGPTLKLDPKSVAAIAYLQEKIYRAITNPDMIQQAEGELEALQRRLNENRIAAGDTPRTGT